MATCRCRGTMHDIGCPINFPWRPIAVLPSEREGTFDEPHLQPQTTPEARASGLIAEAKQEYEVSQLTAQLDRFDEALIHLERIAEVFRRAFTARLDETEVRQQAVKDERKRQKTVASFARRMKRRPARRAK